MLSLLLLVALSHLHQSVAAMKQGKWRIQSTACRECEHSCLSSLDALSGCWLLQPQHTLSFLCLQEACGKTVFLRSSSTVSVWTNLNKSVDPQCKSVHLFEAFYIENRWENCNPLARLSGPRVFNQTLWTLSGPPSLLFLPIYMFSSTETPNTVFSLDSHDKAIQYQVLKGMLKMTCPLPLYAFQYKLENWMQFYHRETDNRIHVHA